MLKRNQGNAFGGVHLLLWHVITAFLLNSTGWTIFHMPAWFVVSVFGTVILAIIGVFVLLKIVFIDFSYDEDEERDEDEQ